MVPTKSYLDKAKKLIELCSNKSTKMNSCTIISHISILLLIFHGIIQASITTYSSIYELLPIFGLPSGLFPDSVENYDFDFEDGYLEVELQDQPCYVQLDEYLISYDRIIKGTLKIGSITNIEGIKIKSHWIWIDVKGIMVDLPPNDNIYLQFGLFNHKLDAQQFWTLHSCASSNKWINTQVILFFSSFYFHKFLNRMVAVSQ